MKREDLRSRIIPTINKNSIQLDSRMREDEYWDYAKSLKAEDYIYIESAEDFNKRKFLEARDTAREHKKALESRVSATDYAQIYSDMKESDDGEYKTRTGKPAVRVLLRTLDYYSSGHYDTTGLRPDYLKNYGRVAHHLYKTSGSIGVRPALHYQLPFDVSLKKTLLSFFNGKQIKDENWKYEPDIREVKDINGNVIYHTLQIGEYPKTKVNKELDEILEALYNGGKTKEGLLCTGRWYSCNGKESYASFAEKHNPEFEYQGNRYVRVIFNQNPKRTDDIKWVKVEPISFIIKNWDKMPKSINPKGSGTAKYFDLTTEEAIMSNIPFTKLNCYIDKFSWNSSTIRGFLNGYDIENYIKGPFERLVPENYSGKCNFLNEAFNLERQPMIEYTIPDSETEIPDDAFNGCISLKKLVVPSSIKSIGKRAFEGLDFKYLYKNRRGELIFSQDLLKESEYTSMVEIGKMKRAFVGLDYNILLAQSDELKEFNNFSEILSKNNFNIPFVYGSFLLKNDKVKSFTENSDFRFFKNELPNINEILLQFPEEEKLDFFKFATVLGCFSKEKMLDKNGKETQTIMAQKATSILMQLLKTDEMKLR